MKILTTVRGLLLLVLLSATTALAAPLLSNRLESTSFYYLRRSPQ